MDGYGVKFGVVSGDYEARGSYVVEGDSYYLVLGDAEVFADGAVRREVDNRRREVTVTEVDTASRNILNNPVRAFDFLGSEYTPSLVSEADGRAVVRIGLALDGGDGTSAGQDAPSACDGGGAGSGDMPAAPGGGASGRGSADGGSAPAAPGPSAGGEMW